MGTGEKETCVAELSDGSCPFSYSTCGKHVVDYGNILPTIHRNVLLYVPSFYLVVQA